MFKEDGMEIKVFRFSQKKDATTGLLFVDNVFQCFTLEDVYRDVKVAGKTRIPAGRYKISLANWGELNSRYLKKFGAEFHKGMLILQDVPNFTGILIHMGNTPEHTQGCILVGSTSSPELGTITSSEDAYRRIYTPIRDAILAKKEVWVTVHDGDVLKGI